MKKLISMVLALMLVVSLGACGNSGGGTAEGGNNAGSTTEGEKVDVPASALEILEKVWNAHKEEEKFFAMGGDFSNPVDNAPGNYSLTDEGLNTTLLVPAEQKNNIDQAASLVHAMMLNNFTGGAYRVTGDVSAFADAMHKAISGNQWICGTPEKQVIAVIGGQYVLAAFGNGEIMNTFESRLKEAYPQADIRYSEAIA